MGIMRNPKTREPCSNLSPVNEGDEVTSIVGMFVTPTASITGLDQTTCVLVDYCLAPAPKTSPSQNWTCKAIIKCN